MRHEDIVLTMPALVQKVGQLLPRWHDIDVVMSIVLPYLRSPNGGVLIDIGACRGKMSRPFLEEGWQSVMFEPDHRCRERLQDLVARYSGRARFEPLAITSQPTNSLEFHVAALQGLSGLSISPFAKDVEIVSVGATTLSNYIALNQISAVDFIKIDAEGHDLDIVLSIDFDQVSPRMIMIEFGEHFSKQTRVNVLSAMRSMRSKGYGACVFCLRALGDLWNNEWDSALSAITVDDLPPSDGSLLFGVILFFTLLGIKNSSLRYMIG